MHEPVRNQIMRYLIDLLRRHEVSGVKKTSIEQVAGEIQSGILPQILIAAGNFSDDPILDSEFDQDIPKGDKP